MSVFSVKVLFIQIAIKAHKMWSFLPISATGSQNNCTDFAAVSHGGSCILAAYPLSLSLSKVKVESVCEYHLQKQIYVPQSSSKQLRATQQSRARLHQSGAALDDPSPMKMAVFSSSMAYLQVLFCFFFKRYPINALLSILGINHEREMTTHSLSRRYKILTLVLLT